MQAKNGARALLPHRAGIATLRARRARRAVRPRCGVDVPRTTVLLVGKGATASRLRTHLKRRGHRVRAAADCGAALEALRGEPPSAVVLDLEGAGFAAASFREMVRSESPNLPLLEAPAGASRRGGDLSLFLAQVDQTIERALEREDREALAEAAGREAADEEPADAPITGYQFE